jgi:hypothetical protein
MGVVTSLTFVGDNTIGPTGSALALALGVTFSERESSYRGGAYLMAGDANQGEQIIVQRNVDLDEPAIAGKPPSATVVYVEGTSRSDDIQAALADIGMRLVDGSDHDLN